jgi:V-type H+-transporting ATPase subunit E
MNDADVSKQIQQMVRFIRQEAEEKANEILVSAEEVLLSSSSLFLFC